MKVISTSLESPHLCMMDRILPLSLSPSIASLSSIYLHRTSPFSSLHPYASQYEKIDVNRYALEVPPGSYFAFDIVNPSDYVSVAQYATFQFHVYADGAVSSSSFIMLEGQVSYSPSPLFPHLSIFPPPAPPLPPHLLSYDSNQQIHLQATITSGSWVEYSVEVSLIGRRGKRSGWAGGRERM